MSNCAKYQVSSFNSLWDIVKRSFGNVGGATCWGGAGLMSRLQQIVAHALVSSCAKYQFSSFNSLSDGQKKFW